MNKFISQMLLVVLVIGCSDTDQNEEDSNESSDIYFTISGELKNLDSKKIYLEYKSEGEFIVLDSVIPDDDKFQIVDSLPFPQLLYLSISETEEKIALFVDNSSIIIEGDATLIDDVNITGSKLNESYSDLVNGLDEYYADLDEVATAYYESAEGSLRKDSLENQYDKIDSIRVGFVEETMQSNLNNTFGPYILLKYLLYTKELDSLKSDYSKFNPSLIDSKYMLELSGIISRKENVQIGQIAPEFTLPSIEDSTIHLSDFRGNYLLIDFWASWCGPCRRENPNLVALYEEYHPYGMNFLGISLDTDRDEWIKAVHDDDLGWTQISDLNGWKNEVARLYEVNSIPHAILIDPDGEILFKNLSGSELESELMMLYKN